MNIAEKIQQALLYHQMGDLDNAKIIYQQILESEFDNFDALHLLGLLEFQNKNFYSAIDLINKAITSDPNHSIVYCDMGIILTELDNLELALINFDIAISLDSLNVRAYYNRAVVLEKLMRYDESLADYDKINEIRPAQGALRIKFHYNRALVLVKLKRFDEAILDFDTAIKGYHENIEGYVNNIGYVTTQYNKSLTLMLQGKLQEGFKLYEWRKKFQRGHLERTFSKPEWLGKESLKNKTILICGEQGFGDSIQFCRYVERVSKLGATVILEVEPELVDILSSLYGVSKVIKRGDTLPYYDFYCHVMSLVQAFDTSLITIPNNVPYLFSDENKKIYWRDKLKSDKSFKIGLVWCCVPSAVYGQDYNIQQHKLSKSIPLSYFSIFQNLNVDFYTLQKGELALAELTKLEQNNWQGPHIVNCSKELIDFSDTAALIENLDLVISVDTSVAHLAGALGKPTWIITPFDACWRWLSDRDDSPWYPTMKIYRQEYPMAFESVLARVKIDLIKLIK